MRKYFIKEFIEQGAMITRCDDYEAAKRLFIKLQRKGANAYMFFYNDKGDIQVKDIVVTANDAPNFNTNVAKAMTDHFFESENSTMEKRYNKRGRL